MPTPSRLRCPTGLRLRLTAQRKLTVMQEERTVLEATLKLAQSDSVMTKQLLSAQQVWLTPTRRRCSRPDHAHARVRPPLRGRHASWSWKRR